MIYTAPVLGEGAEECVFGVFVYTVPPSSLLMYLLSFHYSCVMCRASLAPSACLVVSYTYVRFCDSARVRSASQVSLKYLYSTTVKCGM